MQARPAPPPIPAIPVDTSWLPIIPGPFILLLFLPLFPLILFSVGARPPNSDSLPFSTDEIWQTAALVTAAGSVALCALFYPGAAGEVLHWVKGDGRNVVGEKSQPLIGSRGRANAAVPAGMPAGHKASVLTAASAAKRKVDWRKRHITHLRHGVLSKWYSPDRPSALVVLSYVLFIVILFFSVGHLVGAAFDAEQANHLVANMEFKGKRWRKEQVETRKKYKDDEEKLKEAWARSEKQAAQELKSQKPEDRKKWKSQREKDKMTLVKDLEEKKLSLIGLESLAKRAGGETRLGGSASREKNVKDATVKGYKDRRDPREDGNASKDKKKDKQGKGTEGEDDSQEKEAHGQGNDEQKAPAKQGFGSKLKRTLLGKQFSDSLDKNKKPGDSNESGKSVGGTPPAAVHAGPAWKPADDAVTQAALAASQARAQALADNMRR